MMYRILIADDEQIEKMVLYKTLEENFGIQSEIWQVENGREALELFDEKDIQIAVLDIEMPGINGIEAAQEMRRRKPTCSIIFLTAYDEFSYAKKAIEVRALDYLLKPYQEEELIAVMEEAMRLTDLAVRMTSGGGAAGLTAQEVRQQIEEEPEPSKLPKVAEMIQNYIKAHYTHDLSMQDVAREMNYSEAYFCKLFKQCFDKNFTAYLTEFRIGEAKKLLEQSNINVKHVGERVGYPDSNYFAKVFKRIAGCSPSEYRAGSTS